MDPNSLGDLHQKKCNEREDNNKLPVLGSAYAFLILVNRHNQVDTKL